MFLNGTVLCYNATTPIQRPILAWQRLANLPAKLYLTAFCPQPLTAILNSLDIVTSDTFLSKSGTWQRNPPCMFYLPNAALRPKCRFSFKR